MSLLKEASIPFCAAFFIYLLIPSSWPVHPIFFGSVVGFSAYYLMPRKKSEDKSEKKLKF